MEKINVAIADEQQRFSTYVGKVFTEEGMDVVGTAYNGKEDFKYVGRNQFQMYWF